MLKFDAPDDDVILFAQTHNKAGSPVVQVTIEAPDGEIGTWFAKVEFARDLSTGIVDLTNATVTDRYKYDI